VLTISVYINQMFTCLSWCERDSCNKIIIHVFSFKKPVF
jgi:hypothetical protein